MKILLVSLNHAPERTGIGKYQGELASWLAGQGHDIRVITAPPYYPEWRIKKGYSAWRYRREKIDGAVILRAPIYIPRKQNGLRRLLHLASFVLSSAPLMLWQALFWRPDAMVMTAPPLMVAPVVLFAGWLGGARTYLHVQDFEVDAAFQLGLLKTSLFYKVALKFERCVMRKFSGISTISPNMRKKLLEKDVPQQKTFLIPNWANTEDFVSSGTSTGDHAKFGKGPKTVLVVYSGNLGRKQGLETIVETARLLEGEKNIRFIVSGDGAARRTMVSKAKGLGNIAFLPVQNRPDFIQLMLCADIHLLPQKANAADLVMPSKLGNILASGRPMVACAEKGTQLYEAVTGCGFVVPPEDANAMAEAIKTLAADKALRASMGKKGQERAQSEWSKHSILTRMLAWISRA